MRFVRPTRGRIAFGLTLALAVCWQRFPAGLLAAEVQSVPASVAEEITRLIGELDHPQFATRHKAFERLEALAQEPELASYLSSRFRRALLLSETSFEVRSQLESLARDLPPPSATLDPPPPNASEIVPLLDRLSSDSYAERDSAVRALKAMLAHEELIGPLWSELKRRADNPALSASGQRALEPLLDQAREAWLLADPAKVPLPAPSDEQIAVYLDALERLDEFLPASRLRRDRAQRELLDLIVRDDTRPRVLGMLRQKIAAAGETPHTSLLDLVDFAQPGLAAEVWLNHTHMTVQYLLVGVPQINDALPVPKATLFDRIDDQTAHCVSGNSLTPGDYPVRVALGHPEPGKETMFFLTNLPTPRRRLAYEYDLRRNERQRLESITARTVDYFLKRRAPLVETEVLLLAQLDPRGVSRFVGEYFETAKNAELISTQNGPQSQATVFAGICAVMCRFGTHEAVPALDRLAKSRTLGGANFENRLDVAWVAALAIAARDPWPGIDEWLANLVDQRVPLTSDPDRPPDLGASAAAILLDRHAASTRPFGLETAGESVTEAFGFIGYRFSAERDRADVKRWWQKQQTIASAGRSTRVSEAPQPNKARRIAIEGAAKLPAAADR